MSAIITATTIANNHNQNYTEAIIGTPPTWFAATSSISCIMFATCIHKPIYHIYIYSHSHSWFFIQDTGLSVLPRPDCRTRMTSTSQNHPPSHSRWWNDQRNPTSVPGGLTTQWPAQLQPYQATTTPADTSMGAERAPTNGGPVVCARELAAGLGKLIFWFWDNHMSDSNQEVANRKNQWHILYICIYIYICMYVYV